MIKLNKILIAFIIVLIVLGCKKFEHPTPIAPTSCELCDLADSLNGVYKGLSLGPYGPLGSGWTPFTNPPDTFEVSVQHIFLNKGPMIDSSVMFFHISGFFQSLGNVNHDTIAIDNFNGDVIMSKGNGDTYRIKNDTITINYWEAVQMPYYSVNYIGVR